MQKSLYDQLGQQKIGAILSAFYHKAFSDPLIAHFFFNLNHSALLAKQLNFTSIMLGATHLNYDGMPLKKAHAKLPLREVHFLRRQKILEETLEEFKLSTEQKDFWLKSEERLKSLIINSSGACNTNCVK